MSARGEGGYPSPRVLLEKYGLRAKKSWGQNFLVDGGDNMDDTIGGDGFGFVLGIAAGGDAYRIARAVLARSASRCSGVRSEVRCASRST